MNCAQLETKREYQNFSKKIEGCPQKNNDNISKKIKNYVFKLNEILGKGSFSTVYKGYHQNTNQVVAVKVIQLSRINTSALNSLLKSEIETLQSMNHPNIVNCYDVYFSATNCYIITEFCNDGDLKSLLAKEGSLDQKRVSKIIMEVYEGLKYLEERNIIHRDFKTSNVLMKNGRIKIADFGFAKKSRQNFRDINIGSPLYMSPQGIIENIYGPKTDIWAFGLFIFELLHGKNPFYCCQSHNQLKQAIMTPITNEYFNSSISNELKTLILSCLQIDSQKRISAKSIEKSLFFTKMRQQTTTNEVIISIVEQFNQAKQESQNSTEAPGIPSCTSINFHKTHQDKESSSSLNKRGLEARNSSCQRALKYRYQSSNNIKITNYSSRQFAFPNYSRKQIPKIDTDKNEKIKKQQTFPSNLDSVKNKSSYIRSQKQPSHRVQINSFGNITSNQRRNTRVNHHHGIKNISEFRDLVALVHYCRVLFRTIKLSQRKSILKVDDLYNWLFQILDDVLEGINKIQNPSINIKQLKNITLQYQQKYIEEATLKYRSFITIEQVKSSILECRRRTRAQSGGTSQQLNEMSSSLNFIFQQTELLQHSIRTNNFRYFTQNNNIQNFLQGKVSKLRC